MALSAADKEFYEEKLSIKGMYWLVGATMIGGSIAWPVLLYIQDSQNGLAQVWNFSIATKWSMIGLMVGSMVGVFMYLFFKFLLAMEWLPSRR